MNNEIFKSYQRCVNRIDDFFEYRSKKYTSEEIRQIVLSYLDNLTNELNKNKKEK